MHLSFSRKLAIFINNIYYKNRCTNNGTVKSLTTLQVNFLINDLDFIII